MIDIPLLSQLRSDQLSHGAGFSVMGDRPVLRPGRVRVAVCSAGAGAGGPG